MHTVMGASPLLNSETCWGTLSSRIRKLPRGMLGMKLPLLSRTATSTDTVTTSVWNVVMLAGCSLFLPNLEGIFSPSGGSAGCPSGDFLRGLATVSEDCEPGPCCAPTEYT